MIYVFTGNGKGKTTAAIGTGIRAIGAGKKVLMVQFLKDKSLSSETEVLEKLENFKLVSFGRRGFFLPKDILDSKPELRERGVRPFERVDYELAVKGIEFVEDNIQDYNLIILDEICLVVYFNLLDVDRVLSLIKENISKDFIITGRNCPSSIINLSDLTTEMVEIKHPYQRGITAKRGLDF